GLLYAVTRVLHEANPIWRLTSWALALEVIALTLLALKMGDGRWKMVGRPAEAGTPNSQLPTSNFQLRALAFPVLFFLVAVPWPSGLEDGLVQFLTRLNTNCTVEVLGVFGIPALQRGNVIEISSGLVGIDEACSGIRSFQASLMIALFLGEVYRLDALRRVLFCVIGFGLSFLFNVGRTFLLTWVAAREGLGAMAKWHDPAGVGVLLACF